MKIKFINSVLEKVIIMMNDRINYPSKIARELKVTQQSVNVAIRKLTASKMITKRKEGRRVYLRLTEEGERIKELLLRLKELTEWKKDTY